MNTGEKQVIFDTIKSVLKTQKITYKMLANEMGIAESSVKRIFASKSCSLDQLLRICSIIKISLTQLTDIYKEESLPYFEINKSSELFFIKNPNYFSFFRQLSLSKDIKEIQKKFSLKKSSIDKYCSKLEELGLIKILSPQKIELIPSRQFFKLRESSKLLHKLKTEWSQSLLQKSLKEDPDYLFKMSSTRYKKETVIYFKKEIENLLMAMKKQGQIESLISHDNLIPFGISICTGPEIIDFPKAIHDI